MSGAAWNPKNKTQEQLFEELVINKNEYYDEDAVSLDEYKQQKWNQLEEKPQGLAANLAWHIEADRLYKKLYGE